MTSANVIFYRIKKNNKVVGTFRKNILCKLPDYSELLQYQPLNDFTIRPYGYDEEEEYWEGNEISLERYLKNLTTQNSEIKQYFETVSNNTVNE